MTLPTGAYPKLVFFGEAMIEHRVDGSRHFGGDTLNTAWYLAQLMNHQTHPLAQLFYATAIGTEPSSLAFKHLLKKVKINPVLLIQHQEKEIGKYWLTTDEAGERYFRYQRDDSAAKYYFTLDEPLTAQLLHKQVDMIYLSGISLAILSEPQLRHLIHALKVFKKQGGQVFFDNNYRPELWQNRHAPPWYLAVMALADIAFLTVQDELDVYGLRDLKDIVPFHLKQPSSPGLFILRRGKQPCLAYRKAGDYWHSSPAIALDTEQIVDTCAAGDAFAAGVLAMFLRQAPLENAIAFGHRVAAEVIQHYGALINPECLPRLDSEEYYCDEN